MEDLLQVVLRSMRLEAEVLVELGGWEEVQEGERRRRRTSRRPAVEGRRKKEERLRGKLR